jgi:hypothetical protein
MAKRGRNFTIVKKPPSPNIQFREYREEVRKDINKVAAAHVKSRERVVANWSEETRPKFSAKTTVTLILIGIQVLVKEASRKRPVWKWISQTGTKRHLIKPKKAGGLLVFPWGGPGSYQAKTRPDPARYGGPGTVDKATLRFARFVNHPGFRPRRFDETINKDLEPTFLEAIDRAGRRGLRQAKRS